MAWLLSIVLGVFATIVPAEPVVIFDAGNTLPLEPYRAAVTVQPTPSANPGASPPGFPSATGRFDQNRRLPIRTPEMTPGVLTEQTMTPDRRERLSLLPHPVFLVGADSHSLSWLVQHRERLKNLGAVGLLVQADNADELAAVERVAGNLVIVPTSGSMLAQRLGLQHYPVLISRAGLEQ